jgi:hypothetical protein
VVNGELLLQFLMRLHQPQRNVVRVATALQLDQTGDASSCLRCVARLPPRPPHLAGEAQAFSRRLDAFALV